MIVIRRALVTAPPAALAAGLLMLVSSCDNPHRAALRELDHRGIPANAAALTGAAERSDQDAVKLLLTAGVYPDRRDARGRTPLFYAIAQGDLGIAFRLIDAGADPDAAASDGTTLVSLALARGEIAIADRLLKAGAWPGGRMPDGDDLVPWAIRHGRLLVLDHLFEHGGLDPNQRDATGTPLTHVAFQAGRRAILDALLARSADPSACNAHGMPLTHAAIQRGDFDLVERLLAHGADPAATDAAGRSLLATAIQGGQGDRVPDLVRLGADPTQPADDKYRPLDLALAAGDTRLVTTLVRLGARPGSDDWNDLLLSLYDHDQLDLVAALLAAGIPPGLHDHDGRPIVEAAFADSRPSAAGLFLRYGAPPGDALHQACQRGDTATVSLLLDHHCPTNPSRAPWLDTPLAAAVRAGHAEIVELLLQHGAHPETPGLERQRPLLVAAILGHEKSVGLLLEHGADPEAAVTRPAVDEFVTLGGTSLEWTLKRDERVRPVMLAAHSGNVGAIRHLLDHGARRICYTRYNKRYPINFASRRGHVAAMRLLLGKDPVREQRRIVIDLSEQYARVFDPLGKELFATRVSTGKKGYATPTGEYVITNKYRHWTSTLYHASMPYFQRLSCGDFGMHQGYVPGYPASHGCIRVPSGKASRLFQLTDLGDRVQIVK